MKRSSLSHSLPEARQLQKMQLSLCSYYKGRRHLVLNSTPLYIFCEDAA